MLTKRLRSILVIIFLLFLFFTGSVLLLNSLIQRPSVQHYLLEQLSDAVGYEIHANRIQFIFWKEIGIRARDFEVRLPEGPEKLEASSVRINFALRPLIKGHIVPTGLTLVEPEIELAMENGLQLSKSGDGAFFGETILKGLAGFPSVTLERACITVKKPPLKVKALFLRLSRRCIDPVTLDVTLKGEIDYRGEEIPFSARGNITRDEKAGTSVQVMLKASNIPLSSVKLPDLPVKKGRARIETTVDGTLGGTFSAKGKLSIKDLDFMIIDAGDKKSFSFKKLSIPFDAVYSESKLQIPCFEVQGPGFTLNAGSSLDLGDISNPHLDLSVKSKAMPLETFHRIFPSSLLPQWIETRLFPIFSNGRVRVDLFSLKGKLSEIKNLDLPKNAGALLLRLTCSDLTAFKDAGGVPVEGVSGNLEIEKGGTHVSGVKAHFRNSTILDGSLNLSSLYVDGPSIHVAAAGSFYIEDLLQQKDLPLIPDEVGRHLQRFSSATGEIYGNIEVGYETGWAYPKLLKGKLAFRNCAMSDKGLIFPVFIEEGELIVDGEEKRQFIARGRWGRSVIDASGQIGRSWETGKARIVAQADTGELLGHFYPYLKSSIRFKNRVPCRISLTKEQRDWGFNGKFDLKNVSLETESMTIDPFGVKGNIGFSGRLQPGEKFYISNLTCNSGESSFELAGDYDLQDKGGYDLTVSSRKLRLEDLGVHFKKGNLRGKGALEFDVDIKGSRSQPMMTLVTGEARAHDLFFATGDFPHPVENCDFGLKFRGKDLVIDFLNLKLGKNPFRIKGQIHGWDGMRGELTIKSDYLNLSDLITPEISALFKEEIPDSPDLLPASGQGRTQVAWQESANRLMKKSDIHMDITAPKGEWERFPYGPLGIECALRSGDLYISRSSVVWEHGKLQLRGHVKKGKLPEMLFSGYIDVTKQPLKEIPPSLEFIKSRAEGILTMEALLFAKGINKEDLISSLTGSVNVLIEQGVLKKSHVFIKIMDSMSLQRIFEERPSDLPKEGLYFESIGAHIDLDKGLAKSEDITMRSPVFNSAARGEANLYTNRVNAELGIQPLGTIDSLVSKIPIAGYLLTGDKNALYVDYFKVEGPLSDPDVHYIPLKSLGNTTVGFFKRLLFSPKRVYKSISDAARDFEGKGYPLPDEHLKPENDVGG